MSYIIPNPPFVCPECDTARFQLPYIETVTYKDGLGHGRIPYQGTEVVHTCETGHVTRKPLGERHVTTAKQWWR